MVTIPKILENIREDILKKAENILKSEGYCEVSIRRVARECNTAVGTIYNYFPSKNDLVANIILNDWLAATSRIRQAARDTDDFGEGVVIFYRVISEFSAMYNNIWSQFSKTAGSYEIVTSHHLELRRQVSSALSELIDNTHTDKLRNAVPIIAEAIIAAVNQQDMDENTVREFARVLQG